MNILSPPLSGKSDVYHIGVCTVPLPSSGKSDVEYIGVCATGVGPLGRRALPLLQQIHHHRKVIGIAIEPLSSGMGTLWIALVLALGLEEIVATEYLM